MKRLNRVIASAVAVLALATGCSEEAPPPPPAEPQSFPTLQSVGEVEPYLQQMFAMMSDNVQADYDHAPPMIQVGDNQTTCMNFAASASDARGTKVYYVVGDAVSDPTSPSIGICQAVNLPFIAYAPEKFWMEYGTDTVAREGAIRQLFATYLWLRNRVVTLGTPPEFITTACFMGAIVSGEVRTGYSSESQIELTQEYLRAVVGPEAEERFTEGYQGKDCTKD